MNHIQVAQGEVGYEAGPNNSTKYSAAYGMPNSAWCAEFVSWCLRHASPPIMSPYYSYCPDGVNQFKAVGLFSQTPSVGALVFYDWNADGLATHTGIVESVDPDGTVHTIEGNRELPGDPWQNPEVARHTIPGEAGWDVVLGFGAIILQPQGGDVPAPTDFIKHLVVPDGYWHLQANGTIDRTPNSVWRPHALLRNDGHIYAFPYVENGVTYQDFASLPAPDRLGGGYISDIWLL